MGASELSETKQLQLQFWEAFSRSLTASSFASRKPAPKNWYSLPIGTSRARIVLMMSAAQGRVGCKLAVEHSPAGVSPDQAEVICEALSRDRAAIETELGFSDLDWGAPTGTRIYRYQPAVIKDPSGWPDAFHWLGGCAEGFKHVFGPRIGQMVVPGDSGPAAALAAVDGLKGWPKWMPIATASSGSAPREPGMYMARTGPNGPVIYVGMAGERSGKGKTKPQGLKGRLSAYLSGQGLGGGLLGITFDRALANPAFLRERMAEVDAGKPLRAKDWATAALVPHDLHVRWIVRADPAAARKLEEECLMILKDAGLWNFRA
jgi:hypothetical protein